MKACLCILGVHRFCDIPKSYCLLYDKVLHFENCHPLSRAHQNATQIKFVIFSKDMISQSEISSLKARLKAVSLKKKKTSPKLNRQILCIFTSCQVLLHPKVGQKKFQCFFPFFHFFVWYWWKRHYVISPIVVCPTNFFRTVPIPTYLEIYTFPNQFIEI